MHEDFSSGWSNGPGKALPGGEYHLVRLKAGGRMEMVCLSDNLVGRHMHFAGNRSRPCTGAGCTMCMANQRPRWTGWLGGIDLKDDQKIIAEITERAARQVRIARSTYRTLRGCRVVLVRKGTRSNGPLDCLFRSPATGTGELPTMPDVRPILLRIWGVWSADQVMRPMHTEIPAAKTGTDDRDTLPIGFDALQSLSSAINKVVGDARTTTGFTVDGDTLD